MQVEAAALTVAMLHDLTYTSGSGPFLALLYETRQEIERQTAEPMSNLGAYWQDGGGIMLQGTRLDEYAKATLTVTLSSPQLQGLLQAYYGDAQTPAKVWPQQLGDYLLGIVRELGPQIQAWAEEAQAVESWERLPASVREKVKA
ncbi:MAG: hypothetical protein FJZ90_00085 [Chloroflexi bacterium]|nr:hypothetical protein [Chloroflexota bacterium]